LDLPQDFLFNSSLCILHYAFCNSALKLRLAFGFPKARNAVPFLPLTAFFQEFNALKALEHIPFAAQSGSRAQTPML
jgi:hypothetical protein